MAVQSSIWRKVRDKGITEFKKMLVMFLYLWAVFGLYVLDQKLILQSRGIDYSAQGFAIINALVLAKVMLIADGLKLGHRFHHRSLIFPIVIKACVFAIVFMLFHVAEELAIGMMKGKGLAESIPRIGGGTLEGILCVWGIMFISLAPFFAVVEIGRVIGKDELWRLVFRRGNKDYKLTVTPR